MFITIEAGNEKMLKVAPMMIVLEDKRRRRRRRKKRKRGRKGETSEENI